MPRMGRRILPVAADIVTLNEWKEGRAHARASTVARMTERRACISASASRVTPDKPWEEAAFTNASQYSPGMRPRRFISDAVDGLTPNARATAAGPEKASKTSTTDRTIRGLYTICVDHANIIRVDVFGDVKSVETMGDRLRRAREAAGFKSGRQAALRYGWTPSTYAAHENGQNDFDEATAKEYGRKFKVAAGWLLTGEGASDKRNIIRVMGRIGAGAEISPEVEQVPPDGLFEIETPFPIDERAVAFEVVGDSMAPRYDPGDVVICGREGTDPQQIVGWEAAVRTHDGRRFLKQIEEGSRRGVFDLVSRSGAPPIRNVRLEWVAKVQFVLRRGEWRHLGAATRRRSA